jgi:3'-phosphoadenosine 5'-phosphosulfate sulfotransferase (PAPS reductase)/FAD synthetase
MNYTDYDRVIVAFSGGKDSLACLLHIIDEGCPLDKIEIWHHLVDGNEGHHFMDWRVTDDYCRKVTEHFGLPYYRQWREGGFEVEMNRFESPTGDVLYDTVEGTVEKLPSNKKKLGTRQKFPQVSGDLSVRWCSPYLKIDVARRVLNNDLRFRDSSTLFITGERAQESKGRSKYAEFEPHVCDARAGKLKRRIDAWRPIHKWSEARVWEIIEKYRINPHPAYRLGWGRTSCAGCIFGRENQWASLRVVSPNQFQLINEYEDYFETTIDRKYSVIDLADKGSPYPSINNYLIELANSVSFNEPIVLENWELPAGAFSKEACGAL